MSSRILSEQFYYTMSPTPRRLVSRRSILQGPFAPPDLSLISEIIDGKLYLSGCEAVTHSNLVSRGVTAVVCAMTDYEERKSGVIDRTPSNVKKIRVPIADSETADISVYFDTVTRFVDEELQSGGRVLVHCVAGVSRSTTLVLAYLVRCKGYGLLSAFDLVAEKRKIAWPNDGFYRQLISYERRLKNSPNIAENSYSMPSSTGMDKYTGRSRSPGQGRSSNSP